MPPKFHFLPDDELCAVLKLTPLNSWLSMKLMWSGQGRTNIAVTATAQLRQALDDTHVCAACGHGLRGAVLFFDVVSGCGCQGTDSSQCTLPFDKSKGAFVEGIPHCKTFVCLPCPFKKIKILEVGKR